MSLKKHPLNVFKSLITWIGAAPSVKTASVFKCEEIISYIYTQADIVEHLGKFNLQPFNPFLNISTVFVKGTAFIFHPNKGFSFSDITKTVVINVAIRKVCYRDVKSRSFDY